MENLGTILAVLGAVGFIAAIWMLFGYLYFKKGNLKKGFLLLFISLTLVVGGVFIGVQGAWKNDDIGLTLSDEVVNIIETTDVEDATQEQQSKVGMSVYLKINQEDWEKYEDEILSYYIVWQKSLNPNADDESLKAEFKNLREKSLSN